jgi:ribose transport system permease protein
VRSALFQNAALGQSTRVIQRLGVALPFLVILGVVATAAPTLLEPTNIGQVLRQSSIVGVMALGMTFVLISGRVDLSIGSMLSLITMITIDLHDSAGSGVAVAAALGVGLAVGIVNGVLVGFLRLNALIATLAMLSLLQGATMIYSNGRDLTVAAPGDTWFAVIGRGQVYGIAVPILIFLGLAALLGFLLHRTSYGRRVFAVGGNETTSAYSGLRAPLIVASTYVISGLTTAVAALIIGSRVMGAQTNTGVGYEFEVIAAVALGGTSFLGGSGSIAGSVIGVVILAFLQNGLLQMGLPYYLQWIVSWVIIILAVWTDAASKRKKVLV